MTVVLAQFAEALRTRPGEWAVCWPESNDKGLASRVTAGRVPGFPDREYEGTCRSNGDGTWKVWVRFIGAAHADRDNEKAGMEDA